MKKIFLITFILITQLPNYPIAQELRGTWVAWAGSDVPSKERIAKIMEDVAAANMNIVYVDCWRFGYPYFRSQVFHDVTELWTDPNLEDGRDVLAEMIAEAHRVGLEVEAWFEAGFAACSGNNLDLFNARPHWFAKKSNGSLDFFADGGIRYRWLSHCNREAQQFLIDLCQEVVQKYDVDGIEFDRVRYPDLDCGYDSATVALYQSEHNGQSPPKSYYDSNWLRWRANKLNDFMRTLYDSLKKVNPQITVSNAPLFYGYEQFCQDWPSWINGGYLDAMALQLYFATNSAYAYQLDQQLPKINDKGKFFPGISTVANGVYTSQADLVAMIQTTRNRGLKGHVIWYHNNLSAHFDNLKAKVYQQPAQIPYRTGEWRLPAIIINEDDPQVEKSTGWNNYTGINGFKGGCIYAKSTEERWIEYRADIPQAGWYEVYCFNIVQWSATKKASFQIFHANGSDTVAVDQTKVGLARWFKLGDFYFSQGENQKIVRLSNSGIGDQLVFADAIMLLNTNRPEALITDIDAEKESSILPKKFELYQNFPNPFNSDTTIRFALSEAEQVSLKIYDILGREIAELVDQKLEVGEYAIPFGGRDLVSGIYFYRIQIGRDFNTKKMILAR